MIRNPAGIIYGFIEALAKANSIRLAARDISHELFRAPHDYPDLSKRKCAIYVFSLHSASLAPAGPNRVLKVGKAGPQTIARFKYQYYSAGSAQGTLAGATAGQNGPGGT